MVNWSHSYVQQNLTMAREHMAKSSDRLRDRVRDAYLSWIAKLSAADMPKEMRADFDELAGLVSSRPARFDAEGSVAATMATIGWQKLHRCAALIVNLAARADSLYYEEQV